MYSISNNKDYSSHWDEESQRFETLGSYSELTKYLELYSPNGKILEFGCGNGLATLHLVENHEVLGIDNNIILLEKARSNLKNHLDRVQIHQCDFFDFTEDDIKKFKDFAPDIVIGWNIGTSGEGQEKRADKQLDIIHKPKDYREKVEDIIMKISSELESVKIVNLVYRTQTKSDFSVKKVSEIEDGELQNYDEWVFDTTEDSKFKGKSAKAIKWNISNNKINYVSRGGSGKGTPLLISVVAERKGL